MQDPSDPRPESDAIAMPATPNVRATVAAADRRGRSSTSTGQFILPAKRAGEGPVCGLRLKDVVGLSRTTRCDRPPTNWHSKLAPWLPAPTKMARPSQPATRIG
jgi:hypothetical protein